MNFRERVMNLDEGDEEGDFPARWIIHDAAEIANEADALIAELYEALRQIGACEYDQRSDSSRLDRIFTIVRRFTVAKADH